MQKRLIYLLLILNSIGLFAQQTGTFIDSRDGKIYKTIVIGNQTWMAENLAYKASEGCWAYNKDSVNVAKYGYLYNWDAAKTACPTGWRLASDAEWTTLSEYLGGVKVAGRKLKSTQMWPIEATENATNESGFNALPGSALGYNNGTSNFGELGVDAFFWTATAEKNYVWIRHLNESSILFRDFDFAAAAYSVRCIKD
jgi:uncharacterized protein (TIGR02145 family)